MGGGTRQVGFHELSDRLRQFERAGVAVPQLHTSKDVPTFQETRADGVEIYQHAGSRIAVGPGEVIDSYGNVVDMEGLLRTVYLETVRQVEVKRYLGED